MAYEIMRVGAESVAPFFKEHVREALKAFYAFSVIWHEQSYDIVAREDDRILGAATIRVAASWADITWNLRCSICRRCR